ncbi:hypothetical protein D3C87_616370 [compost metagenome]
MSKLSNMHFKVLRSIAREAWSTQYLRIHWRFSRNWYSMDSSGNRIPLKKGIAGPSLHQRELHKQAWQHAWDLVDRKLVAVHRVRCCPGTDCHIHNHYELRLTPRGERQISPPPPPKGFILFRWHSALMGALVRMMD